jgi:hypothetical protein
MKRIIFTIVSAFIAVCIVPAAGHSDIKPLVSLNLFGGAERGNGDDAGAIGGSELIGIYPFTQNWAIQGSLFNQGGNGGYKFGLSAGPVFAYNSGKIGLFGDYLYRNRGDNNFFFLRGVWAHYFESVDLVLSYSQPVHSVQHTSKTFTEAPPGPCGDPPQTRNVKEPSINELKAVLRYYPTPKIELNGGLLVNSFAGPDRNETGTGFGGVFGVAFQVLDWLILRPVQGQMDTRERYRITSGVELVWTPSTPEPTGRQRLNQSDSAFSVASASGGTFLGS